VLARWVVDRHSAGEGYGSDPGSCAGYACIAVTLGSL
jgi:hypothetical protein